jgi:hypothetical protein
MPLDHAAIERYRELLEYLHYHGYGTFLVVMHGRRPVSVVRIPTPKRLDVMEEDSDLGRSDPS